MSLNVNAPVPRELVLCDAASFSRDAVDLARFLLGKYLFCPQSHVGLLRIIETEAYPVYDLVYREIFGADETQRAIPDQEGVLFLLSSKLHDSTTAVGHPDYLYVTAMGSGEPGAWRPVVLIRSCMPEFTDFGLGTVTTNRTAILATIENHLGLTDKTIPYFRKNLLINPHNVTLAVKRDLVSERPSNPVLYANFGCRLFSCTDPEDPASGPVLCGPRVLHRQQKNRLRSYGARSRFRFVLNMAENNYDFEEREALVPWTQEMFPVGPPPMTVEAQYVVVNPPQISMGIPRALMGTEPAVLGLPYLSMGPPQAPVGPHYADAGPSDAHMGPHYTYAGPPDAPMGPPYPGFPHYRPP